jgi:hypothetical protein
VTIVATASDNVAVESLTFEVGGASPSQVLVPPYERRIDVPPLAAPGSTIAVKATARDAASNAGSDQAVITIVAAPDTTPPTIALQVPVQASPGSTIRVTASATDDVGVKRVIFSTAGTAFATLMADPYSTTFLVPADSAPGTTLTLTARATDFSNNTAESSRPVTIIATPDTQAPTVSLNTPDSVLEGRLLRISASANDDTRIKSISRQTVRQARSFAFARSQQIPRTTPRSATD